MQFVQIAKRLLYLKRHFFVCSRDIRSPFFPEIVRRNYRRYPLRKKYIIVLTLCQHTMLVANFEQKECKNSILASMWGLLTYKLNDTESVHWNWFTQFAIKNLGATPASERLKFIGIGVFLSNNSHSSLEALLSSAWVFIFARAP